ncbi:response regulator [Candidatus Dojkabacteria bacterium]|nr:response regulator [Candidatus Dojkabacteria bacterium]
MATVKTAKTTSTAKKVMIVEDDKPISEVLKIKLDAEGFDVTVAENGKIATDLLAQGKYDLILLDLIMPEMNGFDVLEWMKKENNKTKVIVLTNLSQPSDVEKAKKLGASDYIVKSDIDLSKVVEMVSKDN